ncbi:uncharacterized protein LOC113294535 [Papaver somniferum]|uniref:uncharacterized protein LOC113294535 n=1 Tax=Papaver somniferum TaxID=3469 RepID=UPI000E6FFB97|nr:uncharacterized protein LOC113294535 [Papaver somniferum]
MEDPLLNIISVYDASDPFGYDQFWQEVKDIRILFQNPWRRSGRAEWSCSLVVAAATATAAAQATAATAAQVAAVAREEKQQPCSCRSSAQKEGSSTVVQQQKCNSRGNRNAVEENVEKQQSCKAWKKQSRRRSGRAEWSCSLVVAAATATAAAQATAATAAQVAAVAREEKQQPCSCRSSAQKEGSSTVVQQQKCNSRGNRNAVEENVEKQQSCKAWKKQSRQKQNKA